MFAKRDDLSGSLGSLSCYGPKFRSESASSDCITSSTTTTGTGGRGLGMKAR